MRHPRGALPPWLPSTLSGHYHTREKAELAARAAASVVGEENVIRDLPPSMGAEDFARMLKERPGCQVRLGNGGPGGRGSCEVHNPRYDFNDDDLLIGASYWTALVEQQLDPRCD